MSSALPSLVSPIEDSQTAARAGKRLAPLPAHNGRQRCSPEVLARYANHPSAYLAMNRETRHFTSPVADGFIAYRIWSNYVYQVGNVFAAPERQADLLGEFCCFARQQKKQVCALQLRTHDIAMYRQAGFQINQLGASYTVDFDRFDTRGKSFEKLRNKIRRARKLGVQVVELGVDRPYTANEFQELRTLTSAWLKSKGHDKKLLEFMVGEIQPEPDPLQRIFIALYQAQRVGFITYVPSYGCLPGLMHDLSRRMPNAPPGAMELINVTAMERFRKENIRYLHFGLTPCVGISKETDNIEGRSRIVSWLLRQIAARGKIIYPARSQEQYKLKWGPQIIAPEYIAYEGKFRFSNLWSLLRLTRAI